MNKDLIVNEIKRTAAANNGKPLGMQRFEKETGIRKCDWYGRHWRNWGEALAEAGFPPNEFQTAYDESFEVALFCDMYGRGVPSFLRIWAKWWRGGPFAKR